VLSGAGHAGNERLVARNDVDEKVKLIGFAQRLGDVGARQGATFVGICDDERPGRDLCNKDFFFLSTALECETSTGETGKLRTFTSLAEQNGGCAMR
jgi:hypothetical protein